MLLSRNGLRRWDSLYRNDKLTHGCYFSQID